MTAKSAPESVTVAPAVVESVDDVRKAGPGETVVVSPAGTRTVVEDHHVAGLKLQGYKVG